MSIVSFDYRISGGQPQPAALLFGGEIGIEYFRQMFLDYADAVIFNGDLDIFAFIQRQIIFQPDNDIFRPEPNCPPPPAWPGRH